MESMHRGAWVLVDPNGEILDGQGDPNQGVFGRSSTKSFQAVPLITSGAADAFGLGSEALALAMASHSGEEIHVSRVSATLATLGLRESDLGHGESPAWFDPPWAPRRKLTHGCSGKHAAFLAVARHLGQAPESYLDPDSAGQTLVRQSVLQLTGVAEEDVFVEIDGCSAPTFRLPLQALATGIARVSNPGAMPSVVADACRRLTDAAGAHPELVGGTVQRFDTDLMKATKGRLFSKMGAEGVVLIGAVGGGAGLSITIDDGAYRGFHALALAVLHRNGLLTTHELQQLEFWSSRVLRNAAGDQTGRVELTTESENS